MDHVVYVDAKAGEMEKILNGSKTMIIRGAAGRKLPYGRVNPGDTLYFIRNNGQGEVCARAEALWVLNSDKMAPEQSAELVTAHQSKLQLTAEQQRKWAGKRYLVLVEIKDARAVEPFAIDRGDYGNMDDWLPVGEIQTVRKDG